MLPVFLESLLDGGRFQIEIFSMQIYILLHKAFVPVVTFKDMLEQEWKDPIPAKWSFDWLPWCHFFLNRKGEWMNENYLKYW